jgi:hypothetical protein
LHVSPERAQQVGHGNSSTVLRLISFFMPQGMVRAASPAKLFKIEQGVRDF